MRKLEELSGPWRGRWTQDACGSHGGVMGAEKVTLQFGPATVEGVGEDCDGAFIFRGTHAGTQVSFQKFYTAARWDVADSVTYTGVWNGQYIGGEWRDDDDPRKENRGQFELWPLGLEAEGNISEEI